MMTKARLAIRKVNVALDRPAYYFGAGRSLIPRLFVSERRSSKRATLNPTTAIIIICCRCFASKGRDGIARDAVAQ